MEQLKVFDEKFGDLIKDGVQFLQLADADLKDISSDEGRSALSSTNLTCSFCKVEFSDCIQHREHYKLDWHRYNLKQSLLSRQPLTENEFNEKTDDVSSISGSDTDSDKEETLDSVASAQGKIFLKNKRGAVFSLYRCLLFDRKEEYDDNVLLDRLRTCCSNIQWTVLMLGGGHFAGAVFQGTTPILHKTFHCYTVRAGQGGAQGARDNRSGGSQPKSAGASLRRYNETSLAQHVRDIVDVWKSEINKSSLIIYRAAGPHNRTVLFGGKTPLLERSDPRLRTVPFSTRRATFSELKRVQEILATVYIYESVEMAIQKFPAQKSPDQDTKRNKLKTVSINRAKSREIVERPLPATSPTPSNSDNDFNLHTSNKNDAIELVTNEETISLQETLQSFDDSFTIDDRRRIKKKHKKPRKSKSQRLNEMEALRKKDLFEIICAGSVEKLQTIYELCEKENANSEVLETVALESQSNQSDNLDNKRMVSVNSIVDDRENTLLHVAASHNQLDMVRFLLENNANPCKKNSEQQTAYTSTQSKEIRTLFKQYAQEYPEKYNYNKAQIPLNKLSADEQSEKKRAQRKAKREKEKVKKKENEQKKQEQSEKQRFLNLSDREKRALAAEKRILSQAGTVTARCFTCAQDIAGKVPFEYSGNRFCSIECLKAHRLSHPVVFS